MCRIRPRRSDLQRWLIMPCEPKGAIGPAWTRPRLSRGRRLQLTVPSAACLTFRTVCPPRTLKTHFRKPTRHLRRQSRVPLADVLQVMEAVLRVSRDGYCARCLVLRRGHRQCRCSVGAASSLATLAAQGRTAALGTACRQRSPRTAPRCRRRPRSSSIRCALPCPAKSVQQRCAAELPSAVVHGVSVQGKDTSVLTG